VAPELDYSSGLAIPARAYRLRYELAVCDVDSESCEALSVKLYHPAQVACLAYELVQSSSRSDILHARDVM
jgi:hypothetical protein